MHTVHYCNKQERVLMVLEPPKASNFAHNYSGNLKLIKDGEADFILKCDEASSKCFFLANRDESVSSNLVLESLPSGFNRHDLDKKIIVDETRMKKLLDCIHNFSASPECAQSDDGGQLRNESANTDYPESHLKLIESQENQEEKGTHQMKLLDFS